MTPFLHFRLWLRRAPLPERLGAGAAAAVVAALLGLVLGPGLGGSSGPASVAAGGTPGASPAAAGNRAAPGGPAARAGSPGPAAASGTGQSPGAAGGGAGPAPSSGAGTGPSTGGTAGGTSGASPAPTGGQGACANLTGTDQGVTPTKVKIAVVLPDLEGQAGNGLVGLPPPQTEQAEFQAALNYANSQHMLPCRTLVPVYYDVNPLDANQAHATCLQVVADQPFAALDLVLSRVAATATCLLDAKIPAFTTSALVASTADHYFPYDFSYVGRFDWIDSDYVFGAKQLGWFGGMKKIGLLEEDCFPEINTEILANLAKIGIHPGQITTFDFGCPTGLVPPNETEQAVLQFKTGGVTHVMDADTGDLNYFSKDAQSQDFRPRYSLGDDGSIATFDNASFAPDPTNFNGALAITTVQYGAENSHLPLTHGTQVCNQAMAAGGQPPVNQEPDAIGGTACLQTFTFAAGAAHDQGLTRANLAAGLDTVGPLDLSFPSGPALYNRPGVTTGGEYWRPDVYDGACPCFKVADATWKPNLS